MLTFEEFFQKKKIDLVQLQSAEPNLFAEFNRHYPLMGEKSFDYTKKYWFNNLRRTYPLAEVIKPHAVQAEAISQTATQGVAAAAAQNLNAAIERPKFTEDSLPGLVEENVPEKDVSMLGNEILIIETKQETSGGPSTPKPAFKPRFNQKTIKKPDANALAETPTENSEPAAEPVTKPAFKPRFNMQNIKKDTVKTASEAETEVPQQSKPAEEPETKQDEMPLAKPAFKTRFKMQHIKAAQAENASEESINPVASTPEPSAENSQLEKEETAAKPAYKPLFQMKNVKQAEPESKTEISEQVSANTEPATENPQPATEPAENKEAKPFYKPRFQMKNIPKPAAEDPPTE